MANFFKNWFFSKLPPYFKDNDSYKNALGEGLLERYLRIFGDELDENTHPYIRDFMEIFDVVNCDEKYLPLISSILGYPPAIDGNNATYRKILAYAVAIYKIKGTKRSYEILLNMLGINLTTIEEIMPAKAVTYDLAPYTYDQGDLGDGTESETHYDSECDNCGDFYLHYTLQPGVVMDATLQSYVQNIVCWITPINAKYKGLVADVSAGIFDSTFDNSFD